MESIKTAAIHADARAELANLLEKASEELAAGGVLHVGFPTKKTVEVLIFIRGLFDLQGLGGMGGC